uniref:Endonuclease V n=1 Tax=Macrostomum lignano TaxID=282301 RepID=A0A1I8F664_9PLAT
NSAPVATEQRPMALSCTMGTSMALPAASGVRRSRSASFSRRPTQRTACASLVVLSLPNLSPDFFSFREAPLICLLELIEASCALQKPELMPQALLLDGNGTLHPARGFGLACHVLACWPALPTVGAAKGASSMLTGSTKKQVRKLVKEAGNRDYYIKGESGAVIGCAHVPDVSVKNPVYISCGHMISLSTAVWLVGHCCRYRVPEPTRLADFESREFLRQESAASRLKEAANLPSVPSTGSTGSNVSEPLHCCVDLLGDVAGSVSAQGNETFREKAVDRERM